MMAIIGNVSLGSTFVCVVTLVTLVSASNPTATATRTPKGMEGRVVGGATSRANQFPYLISIGDANTPGNHICGGSLIKPNLVLTAAHCFFYPRTTKPFEGIKIGLTAGEHSLKAKEGTEQVAEVKTLVIKRWYDPVHHLNDIALVELSKPFSLDGVSVKTIKMASSSGSNKHSGTNCTMAGWGYTKVLTQEEQLSPDFVPSKDGRPDTPQFLQQNIMKKDECVRLLGDVHAVSDSGTLCAGGLAGKGVCVGDSGSPLACSSEVTPSEPLMVGIASATPGCGIENRPAVFTSVAFMESWIKKAEAALTDPKQKAVHGILLVE